MVNLIDYVLIRAAKFGGQVFGGYVRDVIVPMKFNPEGADEFKDVDIWFQDAAAADQFVAAIESEFTFQPARNLLESDIVYAFDRKTYHLILDDIATWFNLIISETFPGNDFDVNCLTYDVVSDQFFAMNSTVETLQQNILNKRATLLPTYLPFLLPGSSEPKSDFKYVICATHSRRITNRYLQRGWTIGYGTAIFTDGDILEWIRDQSLMLSNRLTSTTIINFALEIVLSEMEKPNSRPEGSELKSSKSENFDLGNTKSENSKSSPLESLDRETMYEMAAMVVRSDVVLVQKFVRRTIFNLISYVLVEMGNFGGKVFGGYVRDVLVPLAMGLKSEIDFKNVDLWFTNELEAAAFVTKMGSQLVPAIDWVLESDSRTGRQSYDLILANTPVARIDIYVLPKLEVNDFDVNCLTYAHGQFAVEWYDPQPQPSVDVLQQRILAKEARLLHEYIFASRLDPYLHRIQNRFLARGWKLLHHNSVYTNGPIDVWLQQAEAQERREQERREQEMQKQQELEMRKLQEQERQELEMRKLQEQERQELKIRKLQEQERQELKIRKLQEQERQELECQELETRKCQELEKRQQLIGEFDAILEQLRQIVVGLKMN